MKQRVIPFFTILDKTPERPFNTNIACARAVILIQLQLGYLDTRLPLPLDVKQAVPLARLRSHQVVLCPDADVVCHLHNLSNRFLIVSTRRFGTFCLLSFSACTCLYSSIHLLVETGAASGPRVE